MDKEKTDRKEERLQRENREKGWKREKIKLKEERKRKTKEETWRKKNK